MKGTGASSGIGIGKVVIINDTQPEVIKKSINDVDRETAMFMEVLEKTKKETAELAEALEKKASETPCAGWSPRGACISSRC